MNAPASPPPLPPFWNRLLRGRRVRLRSLLLYINLIILFLPITGFWVLRIYENELVRRTEGELLAQGAFLRALYLDTLDEITSQTPDKINEISIPLDPSQRHEREDGLQYIPSGIDLNSVDVLPVAPPAQETSMRASPLALRAGERVSRLMQETQRTTLAGMRLVDTQGVVIASSRGELAMSLSDREEVQRALRGEYVRIVRRRVSDSPPPELDSISRRNSVRLFVALPVVREDRVLGAVVLSRTPLSLTRALYDNRGVLIVLGVVQLMAVLGLSLYASRAVVKPIHDLIDQAHDLARGAPAPEPLSHPITHEVEQLSLALVQMAHALYERADYIKTFASSVSHEFKTPLTTIRGTVELLEDHLEEMTEAERHRFLRMIDEDAHRLQRLVERLLELARADVFEPGEQRCEVAEVAREVCRRFSAEGMAVTLKRVTSEATPLVAAIAPVTLDSILSNLLENARQHGGAEVAATLTLDVEGERLVLEVSDEGPGISEANREKIFAPFFTTARDVGGTGLGLSVVRSLIQAHGGEVVLREGLPTTFRISLPLASVAPGAA